MVKFVIRILTGILAILFIIILGGAIFERTYPVPSQIKYGVTFSPRYARYLKLDWQKTYIQMLDDLGVRNLRIPTDWDLLEPQQGQYDFSWSDFMLNEAGKRGAKVMLVLGARQPRWPECHVPRWAKSLNIDQRHQKTLDFAKAVLERYQKTEAIWAWQVENEPFAFWFGENCDAPDKQFLLEEVKMVKSLDTKRPVIVTDSGEWSDWTAAMKSSDILGVSLYRKSYNKAMNLYITYPLPVWMYPLKSNLVRGLFASQNKKTIISELQVEPWFQQSVLDTPLDKQLKLFSVEDFKGNIAYARKTGFEEDYLWGVEWWYYMAVHGHPEYLDYAATLFK
ncbi:beta-galactosidase [Patescibacteria group bacterium]|nr:beta-galactosidase [Patescibacteria group bacterium]